jgi:hypothetical protein
LPPETLFADVQIVMVPKPIAESDAEKAMTAGQHPAAVYADYLASHFDLVSETTHWKLHRRRSPPVRTSCRDACLVTAAHP